MYDSDVSILLNSKPSTGSILQCQRSAFAEVMIRLTMLVYMLDRSDLFATCSCEGENLLLEEVVNAQSVPFNVIGKIETCHFCSVKREGPPVNHSTITVPVKASAAGCTRDTLKLLHIT